MHNVTGRNMQNFLASLIHMHMGEDYTTSERYEGGKKA